MSLGRSSAGSAGADNSGMRLRATTIACVLWVAACSALAGSATASEPFADFNVGFVSLQGEQGAARP